MPKHLRAVCECARSGSQAVVARPGALAVLRPDPKWREPSGAFVRQRTMHWGMGLSGRLLLAGLLAVAACGSDAAPAARAPVVHAAGSSCAHGSRFALSLAADRGGQPTPAAAAAWFARHGGLAGIPAQGWRRVSGSGSGSGATVESGAVTLHVIQGPDRTWQVDSGNRCP
jgi:hypothetical protein